MIRFCSDELRNFATWLNEKYTTEKDIYVTEVHSLPRHELDRKNKPNKKSVFFRGLGVYMEGCNEIYIADTELMKSILGGDISEFKGFENYAMLDYQLETLAHEYYHHMQYSNKEQINEEDAEKWAIEAYKTFRRI